MVETERSTKWYVGTQNDGLFIIDQPPRPAPVDYLTPGPRDLEVIANVYHGPKASEHAQLLAAAPEMAENLRKDLDLLQAIETLAVDSKDWDHITNQLDAMMKEKREILKKAGVKI